MKQKNEEYHIINDIKCKIVYEKIKNTYIQIKDGEVIIKTSPRSSIKYVEDVVNSKAAWIEAGMSLKKKPAEKVKTKRQMPPEYWEVIYGNYKESLRLCFLPIDDNTQNGYWFGFESEIQKAEPVFKAKEIMERCQNTQSPQINTDKSS